MCNRKPFCWDALSALKRIKLLLDDDTLSDSECIEQICRVFEMLKGMPEKCIRGSAEEENN